MGVVATDGSSSLRPHEDPLHAGREDPLQRQRQDGQAAVRQQQDTLDPGGSVALQRHCAQQHRVGGDLEELRN